MQITRCVECSHPDYEHDEQPVPKSHRCSFGYCKCSQLREQVRETGVPATITPIPAFDHATGKWASR